MSRTSRRPTAKFAALKALFAAALLVDVSSCAYARDSLAHWPVVPDKGGAGAVCMAMADGMTPVDKDWKPFKPTRVDEAGKSLLCTPFAFQQDYNGVIISCDKLPPNVEQGALDPRGMKCFSLTPVDENGKEINPVAERKKALLECDRQPTWLGVLFCRRDSR
jgi:hypothetical protein